MPSSVIIFAVGPFTAWPAMMGFWYRRLNEAAWRGGKGDKEHYFAIVEI